MITELVRFEWRYHTRQPSFLATAALFLLLGFALTATGFGPENVALTSPWLVMESLAFISLFSVFAVAIFVSNAVIRDTEYRMEEIIFSTPIGRFNYLLGRFGGALAAALTSLSLAPIGMMIATRMPWLEATRVGPLPLLACLWSFAVMTLPTLLFATALLFALATATRSALATYTASVLIYVLYLAGAALTNSPLMAASAPGAGGGALAALLDPFGLSSFFEVTRYWTIAEKNHRFVALEGTLLLNRALWTGAAAAIWGLAYRRFGFRILSKAKGKKLEPDREPAPTGPYARVEPRPPGIQGAFASYLSATRLEVGASLRSLPMLMLLGLWFVLALTEIRSELFDGEYGSASYPTTALIIATLEQPLPLIGLVLILYYGAELFWRDQRFRMSSLIDATPVPGAALVLAKWSTMVVMIGALTATGIAAGLLTQVIHGYWPLEPLLYLSTFYFVGLPLAIFAAGAVGIHALSPGKYAGLVAVLLFALATRRASMVGLEHPLWRYAGGPLVGYSAMNGFADSAATFGWLMLHWSVVGAGFVVVAALAWRRLRDPARERLRLVLRHVTTRGRASLAAYLVLLSISGGWILYDTHVRGDYRSTSALLDWKGEYEKKYRSISIQPQPRITGVKTTVEFFPEARRVHIAGDYTLLNHTDQPIRTVHVAARRDARDLQLSLASGRLSSSDSRFGMYRFELDQPLRPGDRALLHFDLGYDDRSFADENRPVVANGSLVLSFLTYPSLGYRSSYELTDPRQRAERGLGASSTPDLEDLDPLMASAEGSETQRIAFDATVSTSSDQIAVATGRLEREWTSGGRRYFHYRADSPILNRFGFTSGRYRVERRQAGDVDVSIFYHPEHGRNVSAMLEAAVKTLEYCGREFARYPHSQLKLVEVPAAWSFGGYALPDTILFNENRTFLVDGRDPDRPDLIARRVAHEVAHQWWGYQLASAPGGGATMLTESLAKYTELMILEQMHGRDHVRQQLGYELDRYLSGRAGEEQRERTLANSGAQPYIYYGKGALVTHAIRDLIGEATFNLALRRLIEEKRGQPTATTLDLLRQLRNVSSDARYTLLSDWMQKIVLYDFRVDSARVEPLPDGRFKVTTSVTAARRQAAPDGTELEAPLDELIDVALFRRVPDIRPSGELISMERQRLRSGVNELSFVVNEAPAYLSVDPYLLRIDRNRFDNGRPVVR